MNKHYRFAFIKGYILTSALLLLLIISNAQVQPSFTKITKTIFESDGTVHCGGYIVSLPLGYAANPTKKYPLLVFCHGKGARGNGSQSSLTLLMNDAPGSIPPLVNSGTFPSSFIVNEQEFSFIIVAAQHPVSDAKGPAIIGAMIDTAKALYRVDEERVYLTGLSLGGNFLNRFISDAVSSANKIAASLLVCPSLVDPSKIPYFSSKADVIGSSNLPVWIISNFGDAYTPRANLKLYTDTLNLYSPKLNPAAKLTIFDSAQTASDPHASGWITAYNPQNTWDGLNVYQWMLQYTSKKLVANAGPDQAITLPKDTVITVDGNKSMARQGRITTWLWSKISGPSGGTITNPADSITTIKALGPGKYTFELKITHTNGSTARDTIIVSTQTQTPVTKFIHSNIGGYYESLPVTYIKDSIKKFPLLINLHGEDGRGNGSALQLPRILNDSSGVTLAERIENGTFPAIVNMNGKAFSFIVISPQLASGATATNSDQIKAIIDTCITNYRIDTNRIYLTGKSMGGKFAWQHAGDLRSYSDRLAAMFLCGPAIVYPYALRADTVASSNLPIWTIGSYGETGTANPATLTTITNLINSHNPNPLAKLNIIDSSGVYGLDCWTQSYDPSFRRDGKNVYEWMLSYTRPQGSPRIASTNKPPEVAKVEDDETILNAVLNPNPVRSQLTIWLTGKSKGKASITLYSLHGQKLAQQQFTKNADEKTSRTFNVSRFTGGTYVVQVIVGGKHKRTLQFIKY